VNRPARVFPESFSMRKAQQTRSLIAAWFDFMPPGELPVAQELHRTVRGVAPEMVETIRQGNLLLSINGEPLLAIAPSRSQVQLLVFNGCEIETEVDGLEGVGRRQRLARFRSGEPVDVGFVARIARASVEAARRAQALPRD
jgi:hypothetical protein